METNNKKPVLQGAVVEFNKPKKAPVTGGERQLKAKRIIDYRKKDKQPFPYVTVISIFTMAVLLLILMINFAEVDRYNSNIAELRNRVTALEKEAQGLEQRLDRKNDLIYIEEYATERLGMINSGELQRVNITLIDKDEGEIYRYEDESEGGIGVLLSVFGESIREFFD